MNEFKYIVYKYPGNDPEIIDEVQTGKEANKLLQEYLIAYRSSGGELSVKAHSKLKRTKQGQQMIQEWNS